MRLHTLGTQSSYVPTSLPYEAISDSCDEWTAPHFEENQWAAGAPACNFGAPTGHPVTDGGRCVAGFTGLMIMYTGRPHQPAGLRSYTSLKGQRSGGPNDFAAIVGNGGRVCSRVAFARPNRSDGTHCGRDGCPFSCTGREVTPCELFSGTLWSVARGPAPEWIILKSVGRVEETAIS